MLHSYTHTFKYIFLNTNANKCNEKKLNEVYRILGGLLQLYLFLAFLFQYFKFVYPNFSTKNASSVYDPSQEFYGINYHRSLEIL